MMKKFASLMPDQYLNIGLEEALNLFFASKDLGGNIRGFRSVMGVMVPYIRHGGTFVSLPRKIR
jgi:hypothetical protein